nr:EOG090X0324 [Polyphemus pediculus]
MNGSDTSTDFESMRNAFQDVITNSLDDDQHDQQSVLNLYNNLQTQDADKRLACDQAFRDTFLENLSNFSTSSFKKLLEMSIDSATAQTCSPTLPVVLLTDAFEILPLGKCEETFTLVEEKVSIWKQDLFFNLCKNTLLRLCNDLLRRLSRSQNTVFCGRILLFLAKFFPFSERSGLNVVSEFNLDNMTVYGVKADSNNPAPNNNGKTEVESMEVEDIFTADYNLYKKFWSLQDFFRNPNQCYTKIPWKTFCSHTNDVLSAFSTIKLDERRNKSNWEDESMEVVSSGNQAAQVQQYFAKYLTSPNLLELQLSDSNFRRYILLQFLIMFQYLDTPVKFKQDTQKLSEEQTSWVAEAIERVYKLLEDTPPDGAAFAKAIRHILKREELWSNWKNEGCPEFRPTVTSAPARPRRLKRSLGDQIREAAKRNKCIIGNNELNRLWNLCPDNLDACRSKDRDFLPTLENYFEEAIEQLDPSVESQYKRVNEGNFGWRALRLLARRSLHFFTHGNTPITRLPDYLETHVKKLAKDMQMSNATVSAKTEPIDEAEVEQMEPETETTAADMDNGATDEPVKGEEADEADDSDKKPPVLCTMEQLTLLAKRLATNWKLLAPKLGFQTDEVEYFVSQNTEPELQAKNMFLIWLEREALDATPENLLYTLEGLKLLEASKGIF